ncbi:hypothetical protein DUHN25_11710 [Helicobacter pylori]
MTIKVFSPKYPTELEEFYAERIADNPLGFIQRLDLLPSISGFVQKLREHGGEFFGMRKDKKLIGICGLNPINKTEAELCKFHINSAYQSQGWVKNSMRAWSDTLLLKAILKSLCM